MGLITEEVEVKLYGRNISYYENLGYEIPRVKSYYGMCVPKNSKIIVKATDLQHGSHIKVIVKCDCCGKKYEMIYGNYYRYNHQGKIYCSYCASQLFISGENSYRWNSEKTDNERMIGRDYPEYNDFVKRVLKRDNYTCQCCGKKSDKGMVVHHLDGYDWCKEKRTNDTNGVALCHNCHQNFHLKYGYGNNTQCQYEEWIGHTTLSLEIYNGDLPTARKVFDLEDSKIYSSAIEYAKIHNVCNTLVYNCCNHKEIIKCVNRNGEKSYRRTMIKTVNGHHLLWLDEYEKMSKEDIDLYLQQSVDKRFVKTICITTGKIFDSITDASRYYKVNRGCIIFCCQGKNKSAGKLPSGVKLQWMYYNDFLNLPQEEQTMILSKIA